MKLFKLQLLLPLLFISFSSFSQNIIMSNGSSSQCTGNFYDSGGASLTGGGKYGSNESFVYTICPSGAGKISLNFTSFDVEGYDYLYIYDGNSTAATSLGAYNNNVPLVGNVQATNSNASGCLTFKFVSDGSLNYGGWVAVISCVSPCESVVAAVTTIPAAVGGIVKLCQGQSLTFNGGATYPQNNLYYAQSNATSTYNWTLTGSTNVTTQNGSHTFPSSGGYHLDLAVTDIHGCKSTNSQEIIVEVSTTPHFNGTVPALPSICLGSTNTIPGVITPTPYTEDCTPPVGGQVYLPDGTGSSYSNAVTVACYAYGQTVTNANQIASICMNMEHSYLGDLDISITCPSGQSITLLDYVSGDNTGGEYLGTPVDVETTPTIAGTGANYCFTSTAAQTMNTAAASVASSVMLPAISYLPVESFAGLVGCDFNGDWNITIVDNLGNDNGYIFGWSIDFANVIPSTVITFTPAITSQTWNANATIVSTAGNTITVLPTVTGSACYVYHTVDNFSCTYDTTVCFMVTPATLLPTFAAIAAICSGATAPTLPTTSTNGVTGTWSPAVSNTATGTYTFTPASGQCALPTTIVVTVKPKPTVTVTNATVCNGTAATITATGLTTGGTYAWGTGQTTAALTLTPAVTTSYTVTYTLNGCASLVGTGTITVNPIPTLTVTNATVCNGTAATITATGLAAGGTYAWASGLTTAAITVTPSATTVYSVTYTLNGCPITATGTVTVNQIPTLTVTSISTCAGSPATIIATGLAAGGTYAWASGPTTASITVSPLVQTTYSVVYTLAGCPSLPAVSTVSISLNAPIYAGLDTPICLGSSTVLTSVGGASYTWNNGLGAGSTFTVSPIVTTTYTVNGTDINGCTGTDQVVITVNPIPTLTVMNATVCNGTAATITATGLASGGTYLWASGQTTASITVSPTVTTTYSCIYTLNGCSSSSVIGTVTVNPIPTVIVTNATVCNGTAGTITATGLAAGGTYLWSGGQTTAAITLSPAVTTPYTVTYTLNGCASLVGTGTITVNSIPTLTVTNATVCNGTTATLTATGLATGGTYLWASGPTIGAITVTPGTTTYYNVTYTLNGCPVTATGIVTVNAIPTLTLTNATVCNGTAATITATGLAAGGTYAWASGETTAAITVSPAITTTYSCIYTLNGCSSTSVIGTVTVNAIPTVTVTSTSTCLGSPATITATGLATGGTYSWLTGQTTATITVSPIVATTYSVIYTLNGCASTSASGTVSISANAPINAGLDAVICIGQSSTLTATGGATYTWDNTLGSGATFTVSPITTSTYTVNGTDINGCTGTDQMTITVNQLPIVSAGLDQTICTGVSMITLSGSGASTYVWDNGVTNGTAFSPAVGTLNYTVTGTDVNGCVNTDIVAVTVNPLPVVNAGVDQNVCIGTVVTLTASVTISYSWDNGVTDSAPFIPAVGSIVYTVTGTDINGCINTDQVSVTVNTLPVVNAGVDQVVCLGTTVTLTASGATTYVWDNGITNGVSITPVVGTTVYTVVGSLGSGCSNTDQVSVTVNALPVVDAGLDVAICDGSTVVLTATGASVYVWDNSVSNGVGFVPVAETTTTLTVIGTDINGCVDTDEVDVTSNVIPSAPLVSPVQYCINSTASPLTAIDALLGGLGNGVYNFNWYTSNIPGSTSSLIAPTPSTTLVGPTTYFVSETTISTGCEGAMTAVQVIIVPLNTTTFTQVNAVCEASVSPILPVNSTNTPPVTGTWSPSVVNTSVAGTSTYTFIPNAGQCASSQTMDIVINSIPLIVITDPAAVCFPEIIDLTASSVSVGSSNADLLTYWSSLAPLTALSSPTQVSISGTYYVQGMSLAGCTSVSPINVLINSKPIASFTPSPSIVPSYFTESTMLNSSINAVDYIWEFGDETAGSIEVSPLHQFPYDVYGDFTVKLTAISQFGCVDIAYETVTIKEELVYYVPNSFTPDDDEVNDIFLPVFTSGYDPYDYSLLIFNRWGQIVFESHDAKVGWNGKMGVDGNIVQNGTYTWKIEFKAKLNPQRQAVIGHVNVIK